MLLFLNDIAGSEVLLILFFILIFFGSKSIPGLASTLGRTIRQIKDASNDLQSDILKSGMDIKKDLNLKGLLDETVQDIRKPLDQYAADLDEAVKFERPKHSHIPAFPTSDTNELEKPKESIEDIKTHESVDNSESK
jgi:sec-independent protein translocase protein TatA